MECYQFFVLLISSVAREIKDTIVDQEKWDEVQN